VNKSPAKKASKKPAPKPTAKPVKAKASPSAPAEKADAKAKPVPAKAKAKPAAAASKKAAVKKPVAQKAPAKPAAKSVAKAAPKSSSKPQPASKAASKPVTLSAPKTASAAAEKTAAPTSAKPAASAPTALTKAPPPKTGRGKQPLTAPSMAPAVASTAAKSSYSMTSSPYSEPMIAPPATSAKKDSKLANNWKTKSAAQMSDAEVMAMPDDEYMNDKQMAFFRLKLVQLKNDILDSAGETTEHLREDTVIVPDPADRATIEEEHALELRTRDRERKLLKKIEQSIGRIDAGDYGYCDETGEPIGVGRLLARPTATLSLEAQQRRELKQKMFGD